MARSVLLRGKIVPRIKIQLVYASAAARYAANPSTLDLTLVSGGGIQYVDRDFNISYLSS